MFLIPKALSAVVLYMFLFKIALFLLHTSSLMSLRILIIWGKVLFSLHNLPVAFFSCFISVFMIELELKNLTGNSELQTGLVESELSCRVSWLCTVPSFRISGLFLLAWSDSPWQNLSLPPGSFSSVFWELGWGRRVGSLSAPRSSCEQSFALLGFDMTLAASIFHS